MTRGTVNGQMEHSRVSSYVNHTFKHVIVSVSKKYLNQIVVPTRIKYMFLGASFFYEAGLLLFFNLFKDKKNYDM